MHVIQRDIENKTALNGIDLPTSLKRVFIARGVQGGEDLELDLKNILPPSQFEGLDEAVGLLIKHIKNQSRIIIVGDYDADGATSTALAIVGLRALGAKNINFLVPDRLVHGYGLTPQIVEIALSKQAQLLITVDNGVSSLEGVEVANQAGLPVIVTDHHLPGNALPDAAAIVNPNLKGNDFPGKSLAGVGVMFYVLLGLRAELRKQKYFELNKINEPNLGEFLDLVALGTIADVVPLDSLNRTLVNQGLKRIRAGKCRPGITALLEIAGRHRALLSSSDLGFFIGPRINAAGRLEDMSIGIQCLLTDSYEEAKELAEKLDTLNKQRKEMEADMQAEALVILDKIDVDREKAEFSALCLFNQNWHAGVVGILASRLKDKFHRPTIVFAADSEGKLKGSARSISGIHIRDILSEIATENPQLIEKFGGHAMAAGLTLDLKNMDEFANAFENTVKRHLTTDILTQTIYTDGPLDKSELNLETARKLLYLTPWGNGFPEPLFDDQFCVVSQRILAGKHFKLVLQTRNSDHFCDAIGFNLVTDADQVLPQEIRILFNLEINHYRGTSNLQLNIKHILDL